MTDGWQEQGNEEPGAGILSEQREANQHLLLATLRATEAAEDSEQARAGAEASARELREMAEFREIFVGIVGHDLRTPLAAILLAAEVLLRSESVADDRVRQVVLRIKNSGHRMSRMVTQLLDFTSARLGGGLPLARRPTDLGAVCQVVVDELQGGSLIRLGRVAGSMTGAWDPDRVTQVLSNIAGNALEHAEPGTPVEVTVDGDDAASVVVEIVNQGLPIPPDVLPFIFDPFRRARQREKSPNGNLGLGLYIAREVVQAHGGTIVASSSGGKTTFSVRLPRVPPVR